MFIIFIFIQNLKISSVSNCRAESTVNLLHFVSQSSHFACCHCPKCYQVQHSNLVTLSTVQYPPVPVAGLSSPVRASAVTVWQCGGPGVGTLQWGRQSGHSTLASPSSTRIYYQNIKRTIEIIGNQSKFISLVKCIFSFSMTNKTEKCGKGKKKSIARFSLFKFILAEYNPNGLNPALLTTQISLSEL